MPRVCVSGELVKKQGHLGAPGRTRIIFLSHQNHMSSEFRRRDLPLAFLATRARRVNSHNLDLRCAIELKFVASESLLSKSGPDFCQKRSGLPFGSVLPC